jgi:acetyl-CoA C-acetyltransferase
MPLDSRTPVLVGAGAVSQREADVARAAEPLELMARALELAAQDAGSRELLARAGAVLVPRGFWDYPDPGRWLAQRFGATAARTTVAEVGVLQTTLFGQAGAAIASGRADVVLVAGGEAKYRQARAARLGVAAPLTRQEGVVPDEVLRPHGQLMHPLEIQHELTMPVRQYAMIENALRRAEGLSIDAHRDAVAALWAGMSRVAKDNPDAWSREEVAPEAIRDAGPGNAMLAFPYTKLHNSQWNVDQAAGLVFCSAATARALGVPRERWVLPLAVADANQMLALSQRRELHRSPGFARAGEAALARAGLGIDEVTLFELYSCFPVAVRVQQRELGVDPARVPTVTGGMAFAGGPLNNFVLQALVAMARRLRAEPGSAGMVNAVSGLLTKQGVSLWSTEPRGRGFGFDDVTEATVAEARAVELTDGFDGEAEIATYTVLFEGEKPTKTVMICDVPGGGRALASSADPELAETGLREELCGRRVRLSGGRAEGGSA